MSLSDTQIKALKPREKPYKVSDDKGLYPEHHFPLHKSLLFAAKSG